MVISCDVKHILHTSIVWGCVDISAAGASVRVTGGGTHTRRTTTVAMAANDNRRPWEIPIIRVIAVIAPPQFEEGPGHVACTCIGPPDLGGKARIQVEVSGRG